MFSKTYSRKAKKKIMVIDAKTSENRSAALNKEIIQRNHAYV